MIKAEREKEAKGEAEDPQHPEGSQIVTKDVLPGVQQGATEALEPQAEVDPIDTRQEEVGPLAARMAIVDQLLGETLGSREGHQEIKVRGKVIPETEIEQP